MKKLRPKKNTIGKNLETTISPFSDEITNKLAFKYLRIVYPILRMNIDGKFKRTILINGSYYSVSQNKSEFVPPLINEISNTFSIQQAESKIIIFDYFKIKKYK